MNIYQSKNTVGDRIYRNTIYQGQNHALHLHRAYEIVFVLEGQLTATVEKRQETANAGEGFFIFPYQEHALTCMGEDTLYLILIVSGYYVGSFHKQVQDQLPTRAKLRFAPTTSELLRRYIVDQPFCANERERLVAPPSLIPLKACLYACCADLLEQTPLTERGSGRDKECIVQVLQYVEEHYTENLSLQQIARDLSYDHCYLSRVFHTALSINLRTLINQYRYETALELLINTDKPVADIAMECGFQSIRSFNRVFEQLAHTSPTTIRKQQAR